jgi:dTDP-4-amino-4,6-dideoxygalactose transaminase
MTTVPFFRPAITEAEISEVVACLRSGWLTTGPRTKAFEEAFARYVGARHAVAVNSCTAAMHLAVEALGIARGDMVLVPALTFAATAEVVRYFDAVPVLVDCEPRGLCIDVEAARRTAEAIRAAVPVAGLQPPYGRLRGIIPMHYGGQMADVAGIRRLARELDLWVVEDAAHTLPAYFRAGAGEPWRPVGTTADVTCFSFYANKCITTGEGGMAVTDSDEHAARMRTMSLHGLSRDSWRRFTASASWDYEIVAPGFKYNLTDIAAAVGLKQLERADTLWEERRRVASRYLEELADLPGLELPVELGDRKHAWHLFAIRLRAGAWSIDRTRFIDELKKRGIATSVHWRPLHLHPYYREVYGYGPGLMPIAEDVWPRLVSLPIFPGMTGDEQKAVVHVLHDMAAAYGR